MNSETSAVICQKHEKNYFSVSSSGISFLAKTTVGGGGGGAAGQACNFLIPGRKQLAALQLWTWDNLKDIPQTRLHPRHRQVPKPQNPPNSAHRVETILSTQMKEVWEREGQEQNACVPNTPFPSPQLFNENNPFPQLTAFEFKAVGFTIR